ncbi:deoxynucleoside kinase [Pseudoalteromonas sp. A25]|uniref:sensor domain-containing diguanylate cyclase n=1 Tax=Pseudoalteromonas sp. A25 TaxID=116092 RepID=UPI0012A39CE8|nr:diguanylate cyclase [Pseudoalteromonas sp. A25]BBN83169.1 deoxynucleoside kinase [Pseudoalteromonas sp. A25]
MIRLLCVLLCMFVTFSTHAFEIKETFSKRETLPFSYVQNNSETLEQLTSTELDWQHVDSGFLHLKPDLKNIWLKVVLNNQTNQDLPLLLSVNNNQLDNITAFIPEQNRSILVAPNSEYQLGAQQPISHQVQLVPIKLSAHEGSTIFIKLKNSGQTYLPLSLWHPIEYLKYTSKFNLLYGVLAGFIVAMVLTNISLYSFTHKHYFLFAGLTIATIWLLNAHLYGFSHRYIYSNWLWLQQYGQALFLFISTWLFIPILKSTLVPKSALRTQYILSVMLKVGLICAAALPMAPYRIALFVAFTLSFATTVIYLALAVNAYRHSAPFYKAYVLMFSTLLLVLVYQSTFELGLLSSPVLDRPLSYLCYLLISMTLSYALVRQFIQERDNKIKHQQARLAQTRAEDALLKERLLIQEQAQEKLETSIDERTFKLEVTLRELQEKNRELEKLNMEDALTKVKNRRYFDKRILMEVRRSRREQTTLSVVMLDIDHFKKINDNYGHVVGDQAICAIAKIIEQHLKRPLDEVFRYGGEEFVLLLPNTQQDGALELAEQIRHSISTTNFDFAVVQLQMTLSAGVYSAIANDSKNPTLFTDLADKALYQAKQQGRNQVLAYE